jgi:hypothetical protein
MNVLSLLATGKEGQAKIALSRKSAFVRSFIWCASQRSATAAIPVDHHPYYFTGLAVYSPNDAQMRHCAESYRALVISRGESRMIVPGVSFKA